MLDVRDGPSTALRVFRMLQGDAWALVIAGIEFGHSLGAGSH